MEEVIGSIPIRSTNRMSTLLISVGKKMHNATFNEKLYELRLSARR